MYFKTGADFWSQKPAPIFDSKNRRRFSTLCVFSLRLHSHQASIVYQQINCLNSGQLYISSVEQHCGQNHMNTIYCIAVCMRILPTKLCTHFIAIYPWNLILCHQSVSLLVPFLSQPTVFSNHLSQYSLMQLIGLCSQSHTVYFIYRVNGPINSDALQVFSKLGSWWFGGEEWDVWEV